MKKDAAFPVILIFLGSAWLLKSLDMLPAIHWLWIGGLVGTGIAILLLDGVTKSSIVAGPLLILGGLLAFLRQYYALEWRFIVPIMLIASGILMLIGRLPGIPESRHVQRHPQATPQRQDRYD